MTMRITEETQLTASGGSDLVFRANINRKRLIFSSDSGPVFVWIDRPLFGGSQGILVNSSNSPVVFDEEMIGESVKKEVRAVGGPGIRLYALGVTDK